MCWTTGTPRVFGLIPTASIIIMPVLDSQSIIEKQQQTGECFISSTSGKPPFNLKLQISYDYHK